MNDVLQRENEELKRNQKLIAQTATEKKNQKKKKKKCLKLSVMIS